MHTHTHTHIYRLLNIFEYLKASEYKLWNNLSVEWQIVGYCICICSVSHVVAEKA